MNVLKKLALCLGITIILPMLVYYGVDTVYPAPKDTDYQVKDYFNTMQHGTDQEKKAAKAKQDQLNNEQTKHQHKYEKHMFLLDPCKIALGSFPHPF